MSNVTPYQSRRDSHFLDDQFTITVLDLNGNFYNLQIIFFLETRIEMRKLNNNLKHFIALGARS